jgi:predicted nuclease of predicted toxin-antitoxin system
MRALLDEQLSSQIAVELRRRDRDVTAVSERRDLMGSSDPRVMEAAAQEGRAVITNNVKDFRPLAAQRLAAGRGHPGLILVPSTRSRRLAAVTTLADGIEALMTENPDGIADSERWLPPLLG